MSISFLMLLSEDNNELLLITLRRRIMGGRRRRINNNNNKSPSSYLWNGWKKRKERCFPSTYYCMWRSLIFTGTCRLLTRWPPPSLPCSGRASHPDLRAAQAEGDALQVQVWGPISGKHPRRAQLGQQQDLPQCAGGSARSSPSRLSSNTSDKFCKRSANQPWMQMNIVLTVGRVTAVAV